MVAGITAALVTAMVLGLWFSSTRGMSIGAAALLTFLYPSLLAPILIGSGIAIYYQVKRK